MEYNYEYINFEGDLPSGVILNKSTEKINETIITNIKAYSVNESANKITSFVDDFCNSGLALYVPENTKIDSPIRVEFKLDSENPIVVDKNLIVVDRGSEVTIIYDYISPNGFSAFHNGLTRVIAKENSIVNIVKLQRLSHVSSNFDSNTAFVQGRGKVNWITIELGSSLNASDYTTILNEEVSESNLSSIYLVNGKRKMDLEYSMIHKGRRSVSNIESRGVLMDHAKKVFRGNLDFRKGAKRASGVEEEFVLLFDPTVKSDSIPALLCEEDDVQGEHAASAGQIDNDKLFYLMSRGLSERDSKKLIVEASFKPIIDRIPLEDVRNIVSNEISRRLIND